MNDLLTGLAMVLVVEGVVFALFPGRMRGLASMLLELPENLVRAAGMLAVALGVLAVWMIRG